MNKKSTNPDSTVKSPKSKKTLYVPDEEILAYGKSLKDENDKVDSNITTEAEELPIENTTDEAKAESTTETQADITENVEPVETEDNADGKKKNIFVRIIHKVFPNKNDSKKNIALKCIAIVAAVAIIVSGCYLAFYFGNLGIQNQVINQQRAIYDLNRYDYTTTTTEGYLAKFSELKRQNNDLVGWITIAGTEVDNPVYQRDNEFYLNHDVNGKANSYGSLFLDERCNVNPASCTQNQIIYGHNMRYGAMFGTLDEYRKINYYKEHPVITFDSLWEHREYKIFAIMITNDTTDDTFGYSFTPYRNDFVNQEDFLLWTEYCKQRSLFDTTVDVLPEDEVITLSTCCYDFNEARFIIVARRVRENESSEVDVENAAVNKDVIYSREYYEKKKLKIPEVKAPTVNVYGN